MSRRIRLAWAAILITAAIVIPLRVAEIAAAHKITIFYACGK